MQNSKDNSCRAVIEVKKASPPQAPENVLAISMNDFLGFLKLTCEVHESLDSKNLKTFTIDYDALAQNEFIRSIIQSSLKARDNPVAESKDRTSLVAGSVPSGQFRTKKGNTKSNARENKVVLNSLLFGKLDEVINEGILDSVLPFICPQQFSQSLYGNSLVITKPSKIIPSSRAMAITSDLNNTDFEETHSDLGRINEAGGIRRPSKPTEIGAMVVTKDHLGRRKSSINTLGSNLDSKENSEVVIHVCDEVKNVTKDFTCQQKLLVKKMGYFADVTAGQKLEDMDISVHCDVQIFEWLMKWVKKDSLTQNESPTLDPSNVIPILISASFLQMEPLLLDCLSFCHSRLTDIVKVSANLSCLNDSIVTRLAAMFTNLELEIVRDKKDRVLPRLWTKMIQSLTEPEPQALRGHFASLANLYRCIRCEKHMTNSVSSYQHCVPTSMRLNRWGQLVSQHSRDNSWSLTNHVSSLYKELRSWRKVYWKLWGECHFLYCSFCEQHFPVFQMNWCQFHPDPPQFLGPINLQHHIPAGRYPCCGKQTYRFETLPPTSHGCQYREHTVQADSDRDRSILSLAQTAANGGCVFEQPPEMSSVQSSITDFWWNGITLMPYRSKLGLLPILHIDDNATKKYIKKYSNHYQMSVTAGESSSDSDSNDNSVQQQFVYSSDGGESESSSPRHTIVMTKKRSKVPNSRNWSGEMSARSNQDNQREYEERAMKQVMALIEKKVSSPSNQNTGLREFVGGSFLKLEQEWRETIRTRGVVKHKK